MDAKFFDSLFEGDSANGAKLGMGLTGGDFWPRINGCHCVYRGQDGEMDYVNIQAVMDVDDSSVTIEAQALPAETIWHYLRRQVSGCGIESADSDSCVVMIDVAGDMIARRPNVPLDLAIDGLSGGRLRLRWRYSAANEQIAPSGFRIYIDTGSGFDFETPHDTVRYNFGGGEYSWTSAALTDGTLYKFVVRSYATTAGQSQNTKYVAARADSVGPAAITGIEASWTEC